MRQGTPIHCYNAAARLATDGYPNLTVRIERPSVLKLVGVLDLATRAVLEAALRELSAPELHLELADLEFADAAGLSVLAAADTDRRRHDMGRVVLHGCRPMLQRTLAAAGLERMMLAHGDDDQTDWRPLAACRDESVTKFFERQDPSPARKVCWSCPVSGSCLSYALRTRPAFGVWGGLTARERSLLSGSHALNAAGRTA
jgi:WhiB family redox-sensing transcriptional regulator